MSCRPGQGATFAIRRPASVDTPEAAEGMAEGDEEASTATEEADATPEREQRDQVLVAA